MIYEVYADNNLIFRSGSDKLILANAKLTLEIGGGAFNFDMLPTHPHYDKLVSLKTNIDVYRDGKLLWSGRIYKQTININLVKSIACENELNFLYDSVQRQSEHHNVSVEDYFRYLIEKHNEQVEENKQFEVGLVTVTDANDSLYRMTNYNETATEIKDDLIDDLGGLLYVEHKDGKRIINYLESYPYTNTQQIRFGRNIMTLQKVVDASDICTCLIPLGAKIEEETEEDGVQTQSDELNQSNQLEKYVTIESVNDGKDFIIDEDGKEVFGLITKKHQWDSVKEPRNLLRKGYEYLSNQAKLNTTFSLTAFDLSLIDMSIDSLNLGDVNIIVEPYNLNDNMDISKIELSINTPQSDSITLGKSIKTLTDKTGGINKDIQNVTSVIVSNYVDGEIKQVITPELVQLKSLIESTGASILLEVEKDYLSKSEKETIVEGYISAIKQSESDITFNFSQSINSTNEDLTTYKKYVENYIRFSNDGKITLGEVNNPFQAELSNVKLAFKQNGQEIAYIDNQKLYITNAHVLDGLAIGDESSGYYEWIVRSNKNMSLKWRGN